MGGGAGGGGCVPCVQRLQPAFSAWASAEEKEAKSSVDEHNNEKRKENKFPRLETGCLLFLTPMHRKSSEFALSWCWTDGNGLAVQCVRYAARHIALQLLSTGCTWTVIVGI